MLALRLLNSRSCVRLSQQLPLSFVRLRHGDSDVDGEDKITVYEGVHTGRVRRVKFLSLTSSAIFLSMAPSIATKIMNSDATAFGVGASALFFVCTMSTPLILQYLTKGYVAEMRYQRSTKTFEADTLDIIGRKRAMSFTADDVEFPDLMGPMSNVAIKGEAYLINGEELTDPEAFDIFMKYDKPIDMQLSSTPETNDDSSRNK